MPSRDPLKAALAVSRMAMTAGDHHNALREAEAAVQWAQALHDDDAGAEAATLRAQHLFATGRYGQALQHGHTALQAWRRLQRPDREHEVQSLLAASPATDGAHQAALAMALDEAEHARAAGLAAPLVQALALLGALHGRLGDWPQGEALLLQALVRSRSAQDERAVFRVMNGLLGLMIEAHAAQPVPGGAASTGVHLLHHAREALALCPEQSDGLSRVLLRCNAAAALLAAGQARDALALLRACADLARAEGFRVAQLKARQRCAQCLLALGQRDAAVAELEGLLRDLDRDEYLLARIEAGEWLATIADLDGRADLAARHRRAVAAASSQHYTPPRQPACAVP